MRWAGVLWLWLKPFGLLLLVESTVPILASRRWRVVSHVPHTNEAEELLEPPDVI